MYTSEALLDVHERAHRNLAGLLEHCRAFTPEELNRELPGFGYPSIRLQLAHVIGAQHYWLEVLHGRLDVDDRDAEVPTIASLEAWRTAVAGRVAAYLRSASSAELDTPRRMTTWGPREQVLAPARVILRTLTHVYHHQGQVVAMCRLLGRPAGGLDFPRG